MEEFLKGAVLHWVQDWGYLAVFLGIMLENAGIPLPGETIIVIASVMAGQKLLNVWYVLAATVSGAVIGPNFGYYVGYRGGRPFSMARTQSECPTVTSRSSPTSARRKSMSSCPCTLLPTTLSTTPKSWAYSLYWR